MATPTPPPPSADRAARFLLLSPRRRRTRPAGYAIDPERTLSATPLTPMGDVVGVADRVAECRRRSDVYREPVLACWAWKTPDRATVPLAEAFRAISGDRGLPAPAAVPGSGLRRADRAHHGRAEDRARPRRGRGRAGQAAGGASGRGRRGGCLGGDDRGRSAAAGRRRAEPAVDRAARPRRRPSAASVRTGDRGRERALDGWPETFARLSAVMRTARSWPSSGTATRIRRGRRTSTSSSPATPAALITTPASGWSTRSPRPACSRRSARSRRRQRRSASAPSTTSSTCTRRRAWPGNG